MSEPQGIEPPAPPPPPYAPSLIYDRQARRSFPVVECRPVSPLLSEVTRHPGGTGPIMWQVFFLLPSGRRHFVWVDALGFTPYGMFGPQPVEADLSVDQLLAQFTEPEVDQ